MSTGDPSLYQAGKLGINLAHFDINTMPDLEAAGRSLLDTNTLKVYDDPRSPAGRHSARNPGSSRHIRLFLRRPGVLICDRTGTPRLIRPLKSAA